MGKISEMLKIFAILFLGILILITGCVKITENTTKLKKEAIYGLELNVYPTDLKLFPNQTYFFEIYLVNNGKYTAEDIVVKPEGTSYANGIVNIRKLDPKEDYEDYKRIYIIAPSKSILGEFPLSTTFKIVAEYNYTTRYNLFICLRNITKIEYERKTYEEGVCIPQMTLKIPKSYSPIQLEFAEERLGGRKNPIISLIFKLVNRGNGKLVWKGKTNGVEEAKYVLANISLSSGKGMININKNCNIRRLEDYSAEAKVRYDQHNNILKVFFEDNKAYIYCKFNVTEIADKLRIDKENLKKGVADIIVILDIKYRYKIWKDIKVIFYPE